MVSRCGAAVDLSYQARTLRGCPGREPIGSPEQIQSVRQVSARPRFRGDGMLQSLHQAVHRGAFHSGVKALVIGWIVELGFYIEEVLKRNLGPVQ